MGILDIGDEDQGAVPSRPALAVPRSYTITVFTLWNNDTEKTSDVRFATGFFHGTDIADITARAVEAAVDTMTRPGDGFECASADVVSMIEGIHDNIAACFEDGEEPDHTENT